MEQNKMAILLALLISADPQAERFEQVIKTMRDARIAELNASVQYVSRSADKTTPARLKQLQDEIKVANSAPLTLAQMTFPPKAGNVGTFRANGWVSQVVSSREAIVTIQGRMIDGGSLGASVKGQRPVSTPPRYEEHTIWFKGIDTAGMVDDAYVPLKDVYEVTGTTTYATAGGGSRTVFVIQPFNIKALEAYVASKQAAAQQEKSTATPADPNKVSASLLSAAKGFMNRGDGANAKKRFQQIIAEYPNTKAATEAKELLERMGNFGQ